MDHRSGVQSSERRFAAYVEHLVSSTWRKLLVMLIVRRP